MEVIAWSSTVAGGAGVTVRCLVVLNIIIFLDLEWFKHKLLSEAQFSILASSSQVVFDDDAGTIKYEETVPLNLVQWAWLSKYDSNQLKAQSSGIIIDALASSVLCRTVSKAFEKSKEITRT